MRIRPSRTVGLVIMAMLSIAATVLAQSAAVPTPHTPDLLGIYPGMPMQAAVAQLQKQSSDVYVTTGSSGFSLAKSSPQGADSITASVTHPPDAPPAVWMISRSWNHMPSAGGVGMTVSALLAGLHAKYGPETLHKDTGHRTSLYWIFDPNGKLLSHADPALMSCSGQVFFPTVNNGLAPSFTGMPAACYKSFFAVTVGYDVWPPGDPMVRAYQLELVNLPYAVRAATIAANAKNAAANRARQAQVRKANRNVPAF